MCIYGSHNNSYFFPLILNPGAQIFSNAFFGQGSGPIGFTQLSCSGTEQTIADCPKEYDTSTCTHADDAGILCQEST